METLYCVVKVGRVSSNKTVIDRNLTLEEAKRIVNSYPDSNRSIVCFYSHENYYGKNQRYNY